MINEELYIMAISDSIIAKSIAFALRDILLESPEQKELFEQKVKEYIKKNSIETAKYLGHQNPEELVEKSYKQGLPY